MQLVLIPSILIILNKNVKQYQLAHLPNTLIKKYINVNSLII